MIEDNLYIGLVDFILNFVDANMEANITLWLKLMIQDGDYKQNGYRGEKMADFKMAVQGYKSGCPEY